MPIIEVEIDFLPHIIVTTERNYECKVISIKKARAVINILNNNIECKDIELTTCKDI